VTIGTCMLCGRLIPLDSAGRGRIHDQVGALIRARTGKWRRRCKGSGRWPRAEAGRRL